MEKQIKAPNIQHFPELPKRIETGPVQFGEDWPGIFIRGDNLLMRSFIIVATSNGNNRLLAKWMNDIDMVKNGKATD
ncbi:MAG TPA: hypothetical protein ENH82_14035 [bacterium]|nr:hypothetical protein [bacterium]